MSKRPGGLTALAVLNFVFGGLGLVVNLIQLAMMDKILSEAGVRAPPAGSAYAVVLLGIASGTLLLVAGVGYLGLKKRLGQRVGDAEDHRGVFAGRIARLVVTNLK